MPDTPHGQLMWKPPPAAPPNVGALLTVVHAGECNHCHRWTESDDVFVDLPRLRRVVCLSCAEHLTGHELTMSRRLRTDTIAAAGKE